MLKKLKDFALKSKKRLVFILILIGFGIYLLIPKEKTITTYLTEKAYKGEISTIVSASGSIEAKENYTIIPRTSTKIVEVRVTNGTKVAKGDVLIKLDETELNNAVKIATYNYNSAIYKRNQIRDAVVVDENTLKQAQQQVNITYIQLQTAKNNLANAIIVSPINGEVISINAKVGDYSSMTSPIISVANLSAMEAILPINEIDINKIKLGQKVILTIDAIAKDIEGEVYSISNNGINTTGVVNYEVKVNIKENSGLKPKMTLEGEIKVETKNDVIIVPAASISEEDGKQFVEIVYNKGNSDEYSKKIEVEVGLNNNTIAEIISGVNENDDVVVNIINKKSSIFPFGSNSNESN